MVEDSSEEEVGTTSLNESIDDDTNNIVIVQPTDKWTQSRH